LPGTDAAVLEADLDALNAQYGDKAFVSRPEDELEAITGTSDQLMILFNGLVLLAVVAAALGTINTTLMSVAERRQELGLLRAVGATRRQITAVVMGESALTGLLGTALGATAGVGLGSVFALAYGGATFGLIDLPLWQAAGETMVPSLRSGWVGLILSPLLAAAAALPAVRTLLHGSTIETMHPGRDLPDVRRSIEPRSPFRLGLLLSLRNLSQHQTRTALTVLAVALGVATIVATGVTSSGVRSAVEESIREQIAFVTDMMGVGLNVAGAMILLAAGFLIYNAFGMAVTQRQRQIGALRALGMTRGCKSDGVMRLVLVEAMVTGGMGTLLGVVAGPLLGQVILIAMRASGYELGKGSTSWSDILLAAMIELAITLLSVWLPARRAARISPLAALRDQNRMSTRQQIGHTTWRVYVGLLVIVILVVYLVVAPPGKWTLDPWNYAMPFLLLVPWLGALLAIAPALIGAVGRGLRVPLTRLLRVGGSLMADNLQRERRRVTLTALAFSVSVMTVVGVTGVFNFFGKELIAYAQETRFSNGLLPGWSISAADFTQGVMNAGGMIDGLKPEVIAEVGRVVEGRADVGVERPVVIPEISAVLAPGYMSSMLDLNLLAVPGNVAFLESDLETALPIMEAGCGVLLSPGAAARNGVHAGDVLVVESKRGTLDCTVGGVVAAGMIPVSFISPAVMEQFEVGDPTSIIVFPHVGVDRDVLEADLQAIDDRYGEDAWLLRWEESVATVNESTDLLLSLMNSLLLLAVVAAALGTINTMVMSVAERRHELGLMRAVGATRKQVTTTVCGEAALIGLIGAALGVVAGAGVSTIFCLAHGGNAWGYPDVDLWGSAWRSLQPAWRNGLAGIIVAPLLSAAAAWFPVRAALRGSALETMEAERQPVLARRTTTGLLNRGSIRVRFVMGTAGLMSVVLAGLIAVVTTHARVRIEEQVHDALRTMVSWNAGLIELGLPDGTQALDFDALQTGQAFDFNTDNLLRFEQLMDDMTENGLVDFVIADRDDVVLVSLDMRQIGTIAPALRVRDEPDVYSERNALRRGEKWLVYATAPVMNDQDQMIGSVRLVVDARELQVFLARLRNALGMIGTLIVLVGVLVSEWLGTPLVRATRQLAAHAAGVGRGEYALLDYPRSFGRRISIRTRLTIAMVVILVVMVTALGIVAIPIERRHVEDQLKDNLVAGLEWIGQAASKSLDSELSDFSSGQAPSFDQILDMTSTFDLARLQELSDQMRSDEMAYVALLDEDGTIVLSDQLGLIGERSAAGKAATARTQIEVSTWRDEEVWVVSTPLKRQDEATGALSIAVRTNAVDTFLDESRNLFRLTGIIAVLAGVLLAQVIGKAVTVPARQLAAGVRRVGQGDLTVQFEVDAKDELSILADAYNQMVTGLQEREWLRDMFGRFVSREVAEAIRAGQVKLEGENRVVSVLFCDIRDFTLRSEQHTPQEIVSLLNEYLPLVVGAAQRHAGTVNKFGGDSTLIIYGAPRKLQESAYQAVLTALEMRDSLAMLNEKLSERGETPIRIGVGINTGMALAGAVGPEERQEYTVIGDMVNLASRIEALNKQYPQYDVLISEDTYQALGTRRVEFELVDLGEIQIRGKARPVRVWAVVTVSRLPA
ncbi:MAG: FtsX-like permease family protein, partial [Anaerolineae bacterium]|nr:FtsX-like permease family protein [Anaerolineae bacterium]